MIAKRHGRRNGGAYGRRSRARRRALQALYQWHFNDDLAAAIIAQFIEEQDFDDVDRDYFESLVREVVAHHDQLDQALAPYIKRSAAGLDPTERAVLRIAACELLHHPEVPYRVVIDEALDLAHRFGAEQGHTFVNGVLDRLARSSRPHELPANTDRE